VSGYNPWMRTAATSRLALVAALAALVACRPTPEAQPVPPDTWAVVDGRAITREDVEKTYRRTTSASPSESEAETLHAKLALLDELILRDILLARAHALQVELPDAELDVAYLAARKDVTDEQFEQQLAVRNLTAADMREALRRDLLTQKVLEREVVSKVTVSDAEVAGFFEQNRELFNLREDAWHLAQIVVTPGREAQVTNRSGHDAATPQEAAQKVEMLLERLKAGTSFRELAAEFSEDAESAPRGGDLGLVPISALRQAPAPLRNAVIGAEPGTLRVVTIGGVHTLVLVVAREAAGQRDLRTPDVRERITEMLRGQREQLLRAAYFAALRSDAGVENHLARRVVEADGRMPGAGVPDSAK
jgi:peptidyl-prolyl cis-trans isomerase SurA